MRLNLLRYHVAIVALLPCLLLVGCREQLKAGAETAPRTSVTALGRVTPGRGVVMVAGLPAERVARLDVKEGDRVEVGAQLALLAGYAVRKAERDAARTALEEAQARMEAETRFADSLINQATAVLKLMEAQRDFDQSELRRLTALHDGEAIAERKLDEQVFLVKSRNLAVEKAQTDLQLALAGRVRTQAAVGLKTAEAMLSTAEAQLELCVVRAPIAGVVLKVLVRPGELTSSGAILQLGDTANMYVVAEVHANDVGSVIIGQSAQITGNALSERAMGTVDEVGLLIYKGNVLNLDPRGESDTRVVEVRIRMENQAQFASLTNLEVFARIDVRSAGTASDKTSAGRP